MAKKRPKKAVSATSAVKNDSENIINEAIASAISSANTILMKLCRLCESKDGPFLNIFDADKLTAKKVEELMPFVISENDELPHKICFRCSAKVEELYEFVQKCVKTQYTLNSSLRKKGPLITKTRERTKWEDKLNKSTLSNDMICDVLIKKAMGDIANLPVIPCVQEDQETPEKDKIKVMKSDLNIDYKADKINDSEVTLQNVKLSLEKIDQKSPTSNDKSPISNGTNNKIISSKDISTYCESNRDLNTNKSTVEDKSKLNNENAKVEINKPDEKPFNIMDHVSKIKVNGVGILFQCRLCNKNFLKIEVVESHGCAKNGAPKTDMTKHAPQPPPPKAPSIKYIKLDGNLKKLKETLGDSLKRSIEAKKAEKAEVILPQLPVDPPRTKPKIGPASRIKRLPSPESNKQNTSLHNNQQMTQANPSSVNQTPSVFPVNFPSLPNLKSRYSFVLGPNNTFTLVEEPSGTPVTGNTTTPANIANGGPNVTPVSFQLSSLKKTYRPGPKSKKAQKPPSPEIIDLDNDEMPSKPYPVGLFKTNSDTAVSTVSALPTFSTPAMKKQIYTVVQTGNPSKLVISSKQQPSQHSVEEPLKKRLKKAKEVTGTSNEPFKVTLEDATPARDPSLFTFINVDPLLQPSYVLPTESIQESKISTSTQVVRGIEKKDKDSSKLYPCNMCNETFSREKKLLGHLQLHYNRMDEEDQMREKNKRRKTKS